MLTTEKEIEIAVRLYENKAYGTTQGKGLYRTALYNGTIDTSQPSVKYLVDLFNYDDWENKAKTDMQMVILDAVDDVKDKLYSWIYRYDSFTRQKTLVQGVCTLYLQNLIMDILIFDPVAGVEERWQIQAKPCRQNITGKNSPQLLAINGELTNR